MDFIQLIGDSGYHPCIMTTADSIAEAAHIRAHIKTRNVIKRSIGVESHLKISMRLDV